MERFYSLKECLSLCLNSDKHKAVLEHRPSKYMFGAKNYGEIVGLLNKADGDCWDVFVPGYNFKLPTKTPFKITKILGYLKLENNNHKIAVRISHPGYSHKRAYYEIQRYCNTYTRKMNMEGEWIAFVNH